MDKHMNSNNDALLKQAIDHLNTTINSNTLSALLDELLPYNTVQKLVSDLTEIRIAVLKLANADLSHKLTLKGYLGGALKTLLSHLRHLTWQAQTIASDDFSQL